MARGLKFWIYIEEGLFYPCSENKGTDQLRGYAKLICIFVFAYAKSRFSLNVALGSAVAWWLIPRTPDPEVGGSSPTQVKPCCVLEQGTLTPPKKYW